MSKTLLAAAVSAGLLLTSTAAFAQKDCKPSKWGKDDEIGSANYVKPDQVKMAASLVKKGESHPLGIVIDSTTPAYPPRGLTLQVVQPGQHGGQTVDLGYKASYNDDLAQLWFGIGPQLDGLGHLGEDGVYYNCNVDKEFIGFTGLKKLGTHNMPPLVGRGVLIDMAKHLKMDTLPAGRAITLAEVEAAMKEQGVEVKQGDVVLFHTGWTDGMLQKDPKAWVSGEPGILPEVAEMLAAKNVMAVGADTWGLDVVPAPKGGKLFYSHVVLLKNNGIYILETMNTGRLAKESVKEFMFVLGQARIRGTVQMIINPVAMW